MHNEQRLFWALSRPLRYLGLTLDEWGLGAPQVSISFYLLNGGEWFWGVSFFCGGIFGVVVLRKFKALSEYFLLKSWLVARNFSNLPKSYPPLLDRRAGK